MIPIDTLRLSSLVDTLTDRTVIDNTSLSNPAAAALESTFGPEAKTIAQDITNAVSGKEFYETPACQIRVGNVVKKLGATVTHEDASHASKFGALLVLGALAMIYDPDQRPDPADPSQTKYKRRTAYAAGAKEIIRNIAPPKTLEKLQKGLSKANLEGIEPLDLQEPAFTELFLEVAETISQKSQIDKDQASHDIEQSGGPNEIASNPELPLDIVESIIEKIPWVDAGSLRSAPPKINVVEENGNVLFHSIDLSPYNKTTRELTKEALLSSTITESLRTIGPRLLLEKKLKIVRNALFPIMYHGNASHNDNLVRCYFTPFDRIDGVTPLVAHLGSCRTKDNELKLLKVLTGKSNLKKNTL